jgi:PTH1 family peptidyl-tRNA hydrolase
MHLIVGLGNPGKRYENTPHNAGFQVCDAFARRNHLGDEVRKFEGSFRRGRVSGKDVGVLKPETYMNLSGRAVAEALRYLPVEPEDQILVYDDMDIAVGRIRLRKSGGPGGHNGIRSVIEHTGTRDFPRLRVGVGRPEGKRDATGHVLGRLPATEQQRFMEDVERAAEALETIIAEGMDAAMNRFNPKPVGRGEEEEKE